MESKSQSPEPQTGNAMMRLLSSAPRFLLLLAGYFLLQIVLRMITSDTTDLDESEQLLATQQLQWGYGPQPPLFTWLLYPLVKTLGFGALPIAILKNALLFGIYALTYASARFVFQDPWRRALATLSLLFLPQIAWESQRDLSHSVIVTFMAVLTFFVVLKLHQRQKWHLYVALGLCFGAGVLSKYSFVIFVAGLLIGLAGVRVMRPILWHPGMLLAICLAAVVTAPHLLWAQDHADWVLITSTKLKIAPDKPWLLTTGTGLWNLLKSIVSHLGPLFAICLAVCWKRPARPAFIQTDTPPVQAIKVALIAMLAILVAGIFFVKVTGFKDRWMMPLCVWMPILLVAVLSVRLDTIRIKRLISVAVIIAVAVAILIPTRIWMAKTFRFPQALNMPFDQLSHELRNRGVAADLFLAGDNWVGGNLKRCFPIASVLTPHIHLQTDVQGSRALLVWKANKNEPLPPRLFHFASQFAEMDTNQIQYIEAPMKFWPEKSGRLGFLPCVPKSASTVTAP